MSTPDTDIQSVEPTAPDANVTPEVEQVEAEASPAQPTGEESSPSVADTDEIAQKAKGVGKRIDELTRNWREEQRRNEALMRLLEAQMKPGAAPVAEPAAEKPKTMEDFGYDEAKFREYLFAESEKRAVQAAERKLREQAQQEAIARRIQSFQQREQAFSKTVPDYDLVVKDDFLPISPAMAEAIQESDDGPALAYHLGKNRDLAAKIYALPPIAAARELGRIEARLAAERERAKAPVVSKAPPPTPKIDAVEPAVNVRPDTAEGESLSPEEWLRKRNKQVMKRK